MGRSPFTAVTGMVSVAQVWTLHTHQVVSDYSPVNSSASAVAYVQQRLLLRVSVAARACTPAAMVVSPVGAGIIWSCTGPAYLWCAYHTAAVSASNSTLVFSLHACVYTPICVPCRSWHHMVMYGTC
jgi:hypothetical protein